MSGAASSLICRNFATLPMVGFASNSLGIQAPPGTIRSLAKICDHSCGPTIWQPMRSGHDHGVDETVPISSQIEHRFCFGDLATAEAVYAIRLGR